MSTNASIVAWGSRLPRIGQIPPSRCIGILSHRIVFPQPASAEPKVVVLQGIDTEFSCEDVVAGWELLGKQLRRNGSTFQPSTSLFPTPESDGMFIRRHTLVGVLQNHLPGDWERSVLGFSYSGSYKNCANGRPFSADRYPSGDYSVFPEYTPMDTCDGVRNAATELSSLLNSLYAREPSREIVLIGHSLGGMVAAYYVVELAPPEIRSKIMSVITLDSPLLGYPAKNPFSACPATAQSWKDISGESDIFRSVKSIQGTGLIKKFVHLNSTDIGGSLQGGLSVNLECGKESRAVGALLGTVVTGGLGGLIVGSFGREYL